MSTTTHGNMAQSIGAAAMHRRSSGVGIIATPFFPYSDSSVWNRNQIGDLSSMLGGLSPLVLIAGAVGLYMLMKKR